ncbi:MAG: GH116 family glycosyl-hydrolase [Akkermansiaceae bacterium]
MSLKKNCCSPFESCGLENEMIGRRAFIKAAGRIKVMAGPFSAADSSCPVKVELEAYTPFIPLNRDESSYPVIAMRYTVTNSSSTSQEVAIAGWIDNNTNGTKGQKVNAYRELPSCSLRQFQSFLVKNYQ